MVNGLTVIQGLAARGELRRYVVVGLGANGPVSAAQDRQLRRLIGPDRDLVLVNTCGPMPWESSVDRVLDTAARDTAGEPGGLARGDRRSYRPALAGRIHPQPSGAKVYARVVLAAIVAQLPHAPPPTCGQPVNGPR